MDKNSKQKVSYYRKPEDLSPDSWQIELRKQIAVNKVFEIKKLTDEHPVFADYLVKNPETGGEYKVAIRHKDFGLNFCTCWDFKTNWLGTCKHIETVLSRINKIKKLKKLLHDGFTPSYSSVFLKYGLKRRVTIRIGTDKKEEFTKLAHEYFSADYHLKPEAFDTIDQFIKKAAGVSPHFRCYDDALTYIISVREKNRRKRILDKVLNNSYFDTLIKTSLYLYQKEGIRFAAYAGRCLIADEMGLGKTVQSIAVAELYKKEFNIQKTLIVCPTSLKYQWKNEIEKFTDRQAQVIEGDLERRKKQYKEDYFYRIVSYNVLKSDLRYINDFQPDLVILDEAQRIKNWRTQTAKTVKRIISDYAIVLTGTPLENRLEELYSIVQFIDPFKLGPLYKFLESHEIKNEHGKVVGYDHLNDISKLLSDIIIRRRKKEVLQELPERTDKHLFVPLTVKQSQVHDDYASTVTRLVAKWRRLGILNEKDRQILLISLNCMRMVCDSTYILDEVTRNDTKIAELMSILDEIFENDLEKVVIFSQWERMTRLVAGELDFRGVGYEYLHGGIPSRDRKNLISNFHRNKNSRVFLSTDAGGLGLNLQCASLLINLDIPWNPAILEQRIGRIHRIGQNKNISVINFVSRESIEEKILNLLRFKSSLFAGVLDDGQDKIFMGEDRFGKFMHHVEKVAVVSQVSDETQNPEETVDLNKEVPEEKEQLPENPPPAELFSTASQFFGNLARVFEGEKSSANLVNSLMEKDPQTGKKYLKIPVENEEAIVKTVEAINGLLQIFKKS